MVQTGKIWEMLTGQQFPDDCAVRLRKELATAASAVKKVSRSGTSRK